MENASKALIIAGGMLIAMLIVGLLVWGFTSISRSQQARIDQEEVEQLTEFNERFEAYNRTTVRGYQMISLANLVYDTNARYREDEGYTPVSITVDGLSEEGTTNEDLVSYIQGNYDSMTKKEKNALKQLYFQCTDVQYDPQNSRVLSMHFERVGVVNR